MLPLPAFFDELEKIAVELSPQDRKKQYLQFAGLGAATGPVVSGIGNLIEHGSVVPPDIGGKRWLASKMLTGAIGMGLLPIARNYLEHRNKQIAKQRMSGAQ